MGKLIKLLLGLTLLFIVIAAVTVMGALLYFDPNEHKDFITSRVENATGRAFSIAGNISLSYYPWLGLEAEGVTLGNAAGFGKDPFVHADKIALRIKTMPLFRQRYELDTLRLHGLQLNLAKNEKGTSNWDDLAGGAEKDRQKPADRLQFAAVILGGVDIRDGRITWQDKANEQSIKISDLNVTTGELTYGAPIDLKVGLQAVSSKPELNTALKLNGTLTYDLDTEIYAFKPIDLLATLKGKNVPGGTTDLAFKAAVETDLKKDTATVSDLGLNVLGTSIKGELVATNIKSGKPETRAQLAIKGDDLARLVQLVDPKAADELGRLKDRSVDMKLGLESDLDKDELRLSNMDIKLLGAVIQGHIEASNTQSNEPSARGMLKARGPDLPALLQVVGQFETGDEPKLKEYGQRLSGISDKSFDVNAEFDADLAAGNVLVPEFSVKTLGINANGQLDGKNMNSGNPKVEGKFSLKGEKLAGVLTALDKKALGEVLQSISIDTGVSSGGGDIALSPLQVKATFAGKQIPDSPADIALHADTRVNLEKQTIGMKNMTLKGLGLDIAGNIHASRIKSETPAVSGNLDARGSDLALLFMIAGVEPLASQLAGLTDRSFNIKTSLDADLEKGKIKLSSLDAKLLGAAINGHIDTSNIQTSTPAATGMLKATGPDLPALMQVLGQFETGKEPKLKEYGQQLSKVADKSFDISAGFDADMKGGNINVPDLSAKVLGISATGQITAKNFRSDNGSVNGKFNLQGDKLADILAAFGQAPLGEVLQAINVDAGIQGSGGEYSLSPLQVQATFAGKQIPNSPVAMNLSASSTRANIDKQTLVIDNLALDGLGLNVKTSINASKIMEKPEFTGNLSVADFNLRTFAQQINQNLPATADKSVFSKVGLVTGFAGSTDSLSLKNMTVKLDDTKLNGDLSVNHFAQPDIKFGITVDAINADRYLPPGAKGKPVTPETTVAGAATELPLDTLRTLRINGDLQIGQLTISNARMTNIKLYLKARDGDIRMEPVSADLYQGNYQGAVGLNVTGKVPALSVKSQLAGVQLDPLLKDYTQAPESPVAGTANLKFDQLTAYGTNADQIKQTLMGTGSFNVEQGVIRGHDVRRYLEQIEIMIETKQIPNFTKGGQTPFEKLAGTLNIENGVVKNKDLLMLSPGFRVTGKGTLANLKKETIDYKLLASVDETRTTQGGDTFNIGGYDLPIICEGKYDDIKSACGPNAQEIIKKVIKQGVLEQIGESLNIPLSGAATEGTAPASSEPATPTGSGTTKKKTESPQEQLIKGVEGLLKGIGD